MKTNFTAFKWILLPGLLLTISHLTAQDIEFAILPLNRVGNLIHIQASAGQQEGAFLIDTGYRGVLLNGKYFKGTPCDLVLQGSNGLGGRLSITEVDLKLGLILVQGHKAHIGDLNRLEKSIGIPLLGILGSTIFEDFELMIDYLNNDLVLIRLDEFGEKMVLLPGVSPPTDTLSFGFKGHLPVIEVQIGDQDMQLGIDSGAASNLFRSNSWSDLEPFLWGHHEPYLSGLGNMRRKTKAGMISDMQLEGIPFRSMRTLFSNIGHINRDLVGPNVDGILGYEFLKQYRMSFNYRKQKLYLWRGDDMGEDLSPIYTAK